MGDLMSDQKRPVGRPRTTLDDLPFDWRDIVLECGQEGQSAVTIRCKLGIGMSAWETLLEDYEEFRQTVKSAKALCEHWWEERGREMAMGGEGNATVWIFNMKNRFGWHDKHQVDSISSDGSMSPKAAVELTDDQLMAIANGLSR